MESTHDFDIQRLERMTRGLDKVHAGMDSIIDNVHAIDLVFGIEVGIKTLLNVLDDGAPGIVIVDKVSESGCINDRQSQADAILFDIGTDGLNRYGFGNDIEAGALAFSRRIERCIEQRVDQGGFPQTRFA